MGHKFWTIGVVIVILISFAVYLCKRQARSHVQSDNQKHQETTRTVPVPILEGFRDHSSRKDIKTTTGLAWDPYLLADARKAPTIDSVQGFVEDADTIRSRVAMIPNPLSTRPVEVTTGESEQLEELRRTFVNDIDRWDALLAMGDIYARGAFPRWQPNTIMAMRVYKLAAMCPDGEVAGNAQVRVIDLRDHPLIDMDRQGSQLPTQPGEYVCRTALDRIRTLPQEAFQKPVSKFKRQENTTVRTATRNTTLATGTRQLQVQPETPTTTTEQRQAAFINDRQNVHDHSVVSGLRHTLNTLAAKSKYNLKITMPGSAINQIKNRANDEVLTDASMSPDEKSKALETIESLIGHKVNETIGTTEVHALALAYHVIDNLPDLELKSNLKESLNKQLSTGVEKGFVVCSTGRLARILGVFDGVEELQGTQRIRPIWAIREEVGNLAARIREDMIKDLSTREVDAYNKGHNPQLEAAMKLEFRRRAIDIYVKSLGMSSAVMEPILNQYSDAF